MCRAYIKPECLKLRPIKRNTVILIEMTKTKTKFPQSRLHSDHDTTKRHVKIGGKVLTTAGGLTANPATPSSCYPLVMIHLWLLWAPAHSAPQMGLGVMGITVSGWAARRGGEGVHALDTAGWAQASNVGHTVGQLDRYLLQGVEVWAAQWGGREDVRQNTVQFLDMLWKPRQGTKMNLSFLI